MHDKPGDIVPLPDDHLTYALVDPEPAPGPAPIVAPVAISTAAPASAAPAPAAEPVPPAPAVGVLKSPGVLGRLAAALRARTGRAAPAAAHASEVPAAASRPKRPPGEVRLQPKRAPVPTFRMSAPAWVVSVVVHVGVLGALGLASLAPEVRQAVASINAAMVDTKVAAGQVEELVHVYADPTNAPREEAIGSFMTDTPGLGAGLGTGVGSPSATPRVGATTNVNARNSLPETLAVGPALSGLAIKPPAMSLTREIGTGGGGAVAGDVTFTPGDIGEALDQIAREILRHLEQHALTIVWMFDESGSMRDDQQAIKNKFGRITRELQLHVDGDKKSAGALTHVVIGFGEAVHFDLARPTPDTELVGKAIDRLRVDESGVENTCRAIITAINRYANLITKERRLILVIATDESGDDGSFVEEARQAAVSRNVPIYVIGRQSMFGKSSVTLPYKDPLTGDTYYPTIRRGPETAGLEQLQYDGLHGRWDEQPSGFAPYELARLTKDTGGIYFLLPSEEALRATQREKAYSMATLKEYVPDYESRVAYNARVTKSPLRRTLFEVVNETKGYGFRHRFPIDPNALMEAIGKELPRVSPRLESLILIERRLRALEGDRDREPEKRWQAHYDLMLAQVVAYQIKAYEYRAALQEMVRLNQARQLVPSRQPIPGQLAVEWDLVHSPESKASPEDTAAKRAEATRLLKLVIERHPKTPWADLAQDELKRGLGLRRGEWHHNPRYDERARLVPKF